MNALVLQPLLRPLLALALSIPLLGVGSLAALFAPQQDPWPRWQAHDPSSVSRLEHADWDLILQRYLHTGEDGLNRFDYDALKQRDQQRLEGYIRSLAATPVSSLNRDEQMAYWINLYNALTVQLVVQAYPVKSILDIDISPGLFADGPWDKKLIEVEGTGLTLNEIEHRILRPLWSDPRVHYALNCASVGCPNLSEHAYRAAELDNMLDAGARSYVNSPRGLWWEGDDLGVSSIYVWFQEDFGGSDTGVLAHLRRYALPGLAKRLDAVKRIHTHGYDWRLNDIR